MPIELNSKVYYTGDMANRSGWFKVTALTGAGSYLTLTEQEGEGRVFHGIYPAQVGNVYQGHCNPRFVTETAYRAFKR